MLSTVAMAQKADVAFTVGASTVSDARINCSPGVLCIGPVVETVKTDRHVFLEGTVGYRLINAKLASVHLEVPFAGVPSQNVTFTVVPQTFKSQMSTVFITPSIRVKLLPGAPISPWVSAGGGYAHFSFPDDHKSKPALQIGGGADIKSPFPHFGFRVEVRDFISGQPSFGTTGVGLAGNTESGLKRHNVLAGGGLVFHF